MHFLKIANTISNLSIQSKFNNSWILETKRSRLHTPMNYHWLCTNNCSISSSSSMVNNSKSSSSLSNRIYNGIYSSLDYSIGCSIGSCLNRWSNRLNKCSMNTSRPSSSSFSLPSGDIYWIINNNMSSVICMEPNSIIDNLGCILNSSIYSTMNSCVTGSTSIFSFDLTNSN